MSDTKIGFEDPAASGWTAQKAYSAGNWGSSSASSFSASVASGAETHGTLLAAGSYLGANTRRRHVIPAGSQRLQLAFGNFTTNAGVEADGTDPFTVRAAIEYPAGTYTPVFFNGRRDAVVEPGGLIWCDPVGLTIPAGAAFWTRTYYTVTANTMRFPIIGPLDSANGEGAVLSATPADLTTSGSIPSSGNYGPAPYAIRAGGLAPGTLALAVVGDSILFGLNDTVVGGRGWAGIAFDGQLPYQKVGVPSEQGAQFNNLNLRRRRWPLFVGSNVALCCYGTNDLGAGAQNLATAKATMQATWATMAAAGMKVFQATVLPRTTSTDSWATTANQTPTAANAVRVALNDWIRTTPAGLTGYIDLADAAETARNSGLWKVNGTANYPTTDGTHPSSAMYAVIATAAAAAIPALRAAAA